MKVRPVVIFAALFLGLAACSGDGLSSEVPEPASVSTSLAPPTIERTTATQAASSTTTPRQTMSSTQATQTTSTTEPVPIIAPAVPGTVIVAADSGVWVTSYQGGSTQLISWSTALQAPSNAFEFAIGDTRGGFIVQPARYGGYGSAGSIVYWIPQGASGLQALLVPSEGQTLRLEEVVAQGDTVGVYYTRAEGGQIENVRQTLRRFGLDTGEVEEIAVVGGWESGATGISVGSDLISRNTSAEAFYGIALMDLFGSPIRADYSPIDEIFVCNLTCTLASTLSPDGSRFAYSTVDSDTVTITVAETYDGSTVTNFTLLRETPWWVDSLDLDDNFIVINRTEGSEWASTALIIDLTSESLDFWEVPHAGIARLIDTLPETAGVIEYP